MSKKVFKYATGQTIPEGAVYLTTLTETLTVNTAINKDAYEDFSVKLDQDVANGRVIGDLKRNLFVWHYFLVEVDND